VSVRGQLFSTDFLVSVLVITVALGVFVHALEFSVRGFPGESSSAPLLSSALLGQRQVLVLDSNRFVQGVSCGGKATGLAWCYPLQASDGPVASRYFDSDADASGALSVVYENGVPLGPAHALPTDVQTLGAGRFSDWFDVASGQHYVLFSSTDGSSPAENGRAYVLEYVTLPPGFLRGGDFCVHQSVSGFPVRLVQDNCARLSCPSVAVSERRVACGSSRCVFSVRTCGGTSG